jgi:hypothetical protein
MDDKKKKILVIFFFVSIFPVYEGIFLLVNGGGNEFYRNDFVANIPDPQFDSNSWQYSYENVYAYYDEIYSYWTVCNYTGTSEWINLSIPFGFLCYYFEDTPNEIIVQLNFPEKNSDLTNITGTYSFEDQPEQNFAVDFDPNTNYLTDIHWADDTRFEHTPVIFVFEMDEKITPGHPVRFDISMNLSFNVTSQTHYWWGKVVETYIYSTRYEEIHIYAIPEVKESIVNLKQFWDISQSLPFGLSLFDVLTGLVLLGLGINTIFQWRKRDKVKPPIINDTLALDVKEDLDQNKKTQKIGKGVFVLSLLTILLSFLPFNFINFAPFAVMTGLNMILGFWLMVTGSRLKPKLLLVLFGIFIFPMYVATYLTFTYGEAYVRELYSYLWNSPLLFWYLLFSTLLLVVPAVYMIMIGISRFTNVIELDKKMTQDPKYQFPKKIITNILILIFFLIIFIPWIITFYTRFIDHRPEIMRVAIPFVLQLKAQFIGFNNLMNLILIVYCFYRLLADNSKQLIQFPVTIEKNALFKHRTLIHFYSALFLFIATLSLALRLQQDLTLLSEAYALPNQDFETIYNANRIFGISNVSTDSFYMHLLPEQFNYYSISFFADLYLYFIILYFLVFTLGLYQYRNYRKKTKSVNN